MVLILLHDILKNEYRNNLYFSMHNSLIFMFYDINNLLDSKKEQPQLRKHLTANEVDVWFVFACENKA